MIQRSRIFKAAKNLVFDLLYPIKRACRRREVSKKINPDSDGFIWIYSIGKTGTSSLYRSLSALPLKTPCYQFHYLSDAHLSEFESRERRMFSWTRAVHEHPILGRSFQKMIENGLDFAKVKVITAIRDPVAANISGFFEDLYGETRIPFQRLASWPDDVAAERLAQIFAEKRLSREGAKRFERRLAWFENELRPTLGIDVYSREFPKEDGYQIYADRHPHTLVLKTEKMDDCAGRAMREFLGIEDFELRKANAAKDKRYSHLYRVFLKAVRLPEWFLDQAYSSRAVKHFYTDREIQDFRAKWNKREEEAVCRA